METVVKERPILFSGEMVRRILDGSKTQTRRLIKARDPRWEVSDDGRTGRVWPFWPDYVHGGEWDDAEVPCQYGEVGDRLWVRESFRYKPEHDNYYYDADSKGLGTERYIRLSGKKQQIFPSIHCPRFASRITLEITDVRVERLQSISEADAKAEGCEASKWCEMKDGSPCYSTSFEQLWLATYGRDNEKSWEANPFCWVICFRRLG